MHPLLRHSQELFDQAQACGSTDEVTVLVAGDGQIQMIAGSDWPLESLRVERGAEMAFRVCCRDGRVRVSGRAFNRSCRLESESPTAVWGRLLPQRAIAGQ